MPDTELGAVTVLVVDEHPIWREGVARDLAACGFSVLATVADSSFTARVAAATQPQVVVIDLDLDERSAVEAVRTIANTMPETRVLVLSERSEHRDVLDAVKAGASGYLVKTASPDELVDAVRRTADGAAVFTPGLADLVLAEYQRLARQPALVEVTPEPVSATPEPVSATPEPVAAAARTAAVSRSVPRLTERETEVLGLVAAGLTSRQTATRLGLSHRTVENHVQSTLRKLHLHNRIELVRYAIAQGLAE
ncbi:MAG: response regulator transcription factor [Actinomycetota bacterium]|nr:response regulator transcription factor [Actinomycetota bacterium]